MRACMKAGLVGGEGFAIDASVIEADASRNHRIEGKLTAAPADAAATRPVREYLEALDKRGEIAKSADDGNDAPRGNPQMKALSRQLQGSPGMRNEAALHESGGAHRDAQSLLSRTRTRARTEGDPAIQTLVATAEEGRDVFRASQAQPQLPSAAYAG